MAPVLKDFSFLNEFLKMRGMVVARPVVKDMLVGTINDRDCVDLNVRQALDSFVRGLFSTTKLIIP